MNDVLTALESNQPDALWRAAYVAFREAVLYSPYKAVLTKIDPVSDEHGSAYRLTFEAYKTTGDPGWWTSWLIIDVSSLRVYFDSEPTRNRVVDYALERIAVTAGDADAIAREDVRIREVLR